MNGSVIIMIAAGFVPPRAYIEQALKHCPTCFGIAIKDESGKDAIIDVVREHKSISVDKMMSVLEGCKDEEVVLTLGNMTQDFNPDEDMMPFVFQQAATGDDEDPENILAIFLEGDASNYSKVGEGHTETFNLWEDLIFPTLSEKYEASSDLDTFYGKLKTSAFKQTIENAFSHRGVAVFMPLIGETISLGRNDLGSAYDWGKTSNTFGWGVEVEKPVIAKSGGKLKSRLAKLVGGNEDNKETHTVDDKGVHHITKTEDKPKAVISEGHKGPMILKPPAKLQGNARNSWIRLFTGQFEGPMPTDHHKKDFTVEVPENLVPFALEEVSTKDQVRNLGKRVNAARTAAKMDGAHEQIQDPKVTEAKPADQPAQKPDGETRPVSDYLPDLSADDKKGSVDLVTDWATRPSDKAPNALEIQRIESKWPVFSTMMGIKSVDMLNWGIADIKELAKKYPDAIALAFLEMKSIAVANGAFKDHFEALQKAKDKKPEPAKVEKVEKKEEIVAAKPAGKKLSRLERLTQAA